MSLHASRNRLEMLTNTLLLEWAETANHWRDARGQEFERQYLQELSARVNKAATTIEKLDAVLEKVKHDCE